MRPVPAGKSLRMSFSRQKEVLEMPNLIEIQKNSYQWFLDEGLKEVFEDISPIADFAGHLSLEFVDFTLCKDDIKYTIEECKERDATYAAPLKVKVRLCNKDKDEINELLLPTIPIERVEYRENIKNKNELIHDLKEKAVKLYEDKEALFPEAEQIREIERVILLKVIDRKWMDHIDDMDQLKQGIGLQALGQRDPVVQYKMMGYDMFDEMTAGITEDTVRLLMHIQVEQKVEREQVAKVTGTNKDEGPSVKGPARRTEKKIYPNDPCPCGSGKKYKNCCGRQA